ncbi:MAG: murein biosynthesis integral membrane protein MurJ [Candidatus Pacebacteria bacterium]|nr:murein biosynthesis integral membrane protein MurJ [Candidatus Paceibacterota bacterium]
MAGIFKKIMNFESKSISGGAFVIAIFYILNGVLGLIRNGLLASKFGASRILDIYWASFRIPDLLYVIFISGALSAGFIPFFAQKLKQSKEESWRLANNILSTLIFMMMVLAILMIFLAPLIVPLIVPGFDKADQAQVVSFLRIMMIQPIFLGISSILSGVLQTFRRFFITSLSPIFYNLGIIIGIVFFTQIMGPIGLAYGVVFGSLLHLAILLPTLKNVGFHFKFLPDFHSTNLKQLFSIAGPRTLSLISTQINFFVITIIASTLKEGSLAIFNFANDLQYLPQNIFAVSFAISAFPILSSLVHEREKFNETMVQTIKNILLFLIPISVFYFVFRSPLVNLTLRYGNFNISAANEALEVLGIFALGMVASGLLPLLIRVFFAKQDAYRPFFAGLSANVLNVILSLILAPQWGIKGLACSFVISSYFNLILLWIWLIRRKIIEMNIVDWKKLGRFILNNLFCATIAGVVSYLYLKFTYQLFTTTSFWSLFLQLFIGGVVFIGAYGGIFYLLMRDDFLNFFRENSFIKKLFKKPDEV